MLTGTVSVNQCKLDRSECELIRDFGLLSGNQDSRQLIEIALMKPSL